MSSKKLRNIAILDLLTSAALLLVSILIWWPLRYLPFFWDSAGFVVNAARSLQASHFWPFIATQSDFAHPPLFIAALAGMWQIFGPSRLAAHLLSFVFLPTFLIATYFFAKKILSPTFAVVAAFLLAFTPALLAEVGMVYVDLPTAALAAVSLCAWVYRRRFISMVFLTLACLTKETAITLLPLYLFWLYRESPRPTPKQYAQTLLPPLVLFFWFYYHYTTTGWWFSSPAAPLSARMVTSFDQLLLSLQFVGEDFFIHQYRWVATLAVAASLTYLYTRTKKFFRAPETLTMAGLLLPLIAGLGFFALTQEYITHYALYILPLWYIGALWVTEKAVAVAPQSPRFLHAPLAATLFLAGLLITAWHPSLPTTQRYEFAEPTDLTNLDTIHIFRQAAAYLSAAAPEALIYGGFPENLQLTQPYQGYVHESRQFDLCANFQPQEKIPQVVYLHPYSPSQIDCRRLMDQYSLTPIQRFERNGKWVELYRYQATSSATPAPSAQ